MMLNFEDRTIQDWIDIYISGDKYKDVRLLYGLSDISKYAGKSYSAVLTKYRSVQSMEKLIDYYKPDERIYNGIVITSSSNMSDIAEQLGVPSANFCAYVRCHGRTIEDGIDYYMGLSGRIKTKEIISSSGETQRIRIDYCDEEYELVDRLYKDGNTWTYICESVNNLECNIKKQLKRNPKSLRTWYQSRKRLTGSNDYEPRFEYNRLSDEELQIMCDMRNDGAKWNDIADALNKLESNISLGIIRDGRRISRAYCDRMRRNGHVI